MSEEGAGGVLYPLSSPTVSRISGGACFRVEVLYMRCTGETSGS